MANTEKLRALPWIVDAANRWLDANVSPDWDVLEYGCGASTVWFAPRVKSLVSVEHHPVWAARIRSEISMLDPVQIVKRQRPYASFPLPRHGRFDFVLVDGRDRVECVRASLVRVKPGGVLMLDNSERLKYFPAFEALVNWEKLGDEVQIGPDMCGFSYPGWRTTWWRKPE